MLLIKQITPSTQCNCMECDAGGATAEGMVGGSKKSVLPTWRHLVSRGEKDEGEEKKQSRKFSITHGIT